MKRAGTRTIGMLLDTYILASIEEALSDDIAYANEEKDDVMATILNEANAYDLKPVLGEIISLAIHRTIISMSRGEILDPKEKSKLLHNVNTHNVDRVASVAEIDAVLNPNDLSYSAKTYGDNYVTTKTPLQIMIDDLTTSKLKLVIDKSLELKDRVAILESAIVNDMTSDITDKEIDLINLVLSTTICFFVHEIMMNGDKGGLDTADAIRKIVETNGIRKLAMKRASTLSEEK